MSIAAARKAVSVEPSDSDLRAAYERCRRPTWPPTYQDAMDDPVCSRLIRMSALHPAQPAQRRGHPWPFMAAVKYRPAPPPAAANASTWTPLRVYDLKRAAAGDRDD